MFRKFVWSILTVGMLGGFPLASDLVAAESSLPSPNPGLYATVPEPFTPAECGRCHTSQFTALKERGGKHRFACQECHEVFHAYNPRKDNYAELMPDCMNCHTLPHGPQVTDCLTCHSNPHAPTEVPAVGRLEDACGQCHSGPATLLKKYPSAHSELDCQGCHFERHGYIPDCFTCHEGHHPQQQVASCADCHAQVHRPLAVTLQPETDVKTCGSCHDTVYAQWQDTPSKHGQVNCGMCHPQHGAALDCRECHAEPHSPQQLKMFPDCLTCHINPHDLPVKQ